jgi:hypothetical protein
MTPSPETIRLASEHYLCEPYPESHDEMTKEELCQFIEAEAWQPFEYWPAQDVYERINDLAVFLCENAEKINWRGI